MAYPFYQSPYQQFGGYYPQGYQPAAQPQMVQPQQMQPTQMPVANQAPSTSGIIWVSGAQEAQMYPVAPNNAVALWENSGKLIYLKQALRSTSCGIGSSGRENARLCQPRGRGVPCRSREGHPRRH